MFINLASTAPVLDHQRCPKQLVLRVADVTASVSVGEGFVVESPTGGPQFQPVVEVQWLDRAINRSTTWREYVIQPRMFHAQDVSFEFLGCSAVQGVRDSYTSVAFTLNYDGESWDLGVIHGDADNDGVMLWIPLPGYDPLCNDPTPLQVELDEAKEPEPPKVRRSIWERLNG